MIGGREKKGGTRRRERDGRDGESRGDEEARRRKEKGAKGRRVIYNKESPSLSRSSGS